MRITYTKDPLKKRHNKGKVEPPLFYSEELWSSLMLHFRSLYYHRDQRASWWDEDKVMSFSYCTKTSSVSPVPTLPFRHHQGSVGGRLATWQPYCLGPSLLLTPFYSFVTSLLFPSPSKGTLDFYVKQLHNQINVTTVRILLPCNLP